MSGRTTGERVSGLRAALRHEEAPFPLEEEGGFLLS